MIGVSTLLWSSQPLLHCAFQRKKLEHRTCVDICVAFEEYGEYSTLIKFFGLSPNITYKGKTKHV
jgi:hypothetical protein